MAFTVTTAWEVEAGADDSFGGGFDTGVAGFPTDGTVDANTGNTSAPVFSSASYNFVAGDVNAWIYIKAGTSAFFGWYKITAVGSNKATLDAAIGHGALQPSVFGNIAPSTALGIASIGTPSGLTWGIDYSQSTTARFTSTHLSIDGTTNTKLTDADNTIGKNWVGNIINITSGTGFTVQRVAVVSTSGTAATVDKSLGTLSSSGGNGKLGGALASLGQAGALYVTSNAIFVKNGAYTITSASTNISGGCFSFVAAQGSPLYVNGYGSVHGDNDINNRPTQTLNAGVTGAVVITRTGAPVCTLRNIIIDCASQTTSQGVTLVPGNPVSLYQVLVKNATTNGIQLGAQGTAVRCAATGCSALPFSGPGSAVFWECEAYANTATPFTVAGGGDLTCINCLSYKNTGGTTDGFGAFVYCIDCTSYQNGRDGFRTPPVAINCIAEANTGIGLNVVASAYAVNCAAFNNTGGDIPASVYALNCLIPTASMFVDPTNNNFALNGSPTGGGLVRSTGAPGTYPRGLTTGYADMGAVQGAANGSDEPRIHRDVI